jgi:hypothetical protein
MAPDAVGISEPMSKGRKLRLKRKQESSILDDLTQKVKQYGI